MDEPKMMASHDSTADPPMTPQEAKAIVTHYGGKPPDELWGKLSGEEKKTLMNAIPVDAGAPGVGPNVGAGLIGLGSKALNYAPKVVGAGAGIAGAAKSGILNYAGWKGGEAIGDAIGLPKPLTDILSLMLGHGAGRMGGGGGSPAGPALSEEEQALAGMQERGSKITKSTPPTPLENIPRPYPVPQTGPDFKTPSTPPPLTRADMPPNVDFHRTNADLAEQVGRGVQNDFRGRVSLKKGNGIIDPEAQSQRDQTGGAYQPSPFEALRQELGKKGPIPPDIASGLDRAQFPNVEKLGKKEFNAIIAPEKTKETLDRNAPSPAGPLVVRRPVPETSEDKFIPHEFPPGTDNHTKPNVFEQASRDYADSQTNPDAFASAQAEIKKALDAHYTSKLKKHPR